MSACSSRISTAVLLFWFVLSTSTTLIAQPSRIGVSLSVGTIDNTQAQYVNLPHEALSVRFELSSVIARLKKSGAYFGASVSASWWDDGVGLEDITWADSPTLYTHGGKAVGARLTIGSDKIATPIKIWAGYTQHFDSGKIVDGSPPFGNPQKTEDNHRSMDIGARFSFPIWPSILLGMEVERTFRDLDRVYRADKNPKTCFGLVATYLL